MRQSLRQLIRIDHDLRLTQLLLRGLELGLGGCHSGVNTIPLALLHVGQLLLRAACAGLGIVPRRQGSSVGAIGTVDTV